MFDIVLLGCASSTQSTAQSTPQNKDKLTLGIVQKEIKPGMSQAEVAEVMGSPNIVTSDAAGKETWIYDRINSKVEYKRSSGYGTLILIGGGSESGGATTSQESLTVIIKFDNNIVKEVKYHASKF